VQVKALLAQASSAKSIANLALLLIHLVLLRVPYAVANQYMIQIKQP
jgi:hypothetical protein